MNVQELSEWTDNTDPKARVVITDGDQEDLRDVEKIEYCAELNELHLTVAALR